MIGRLNARTGRLIREDGTTINEADLIATQAQVINAQNSLLALQEATLTRLATQGDDLVAQGVDLMVYADAEHDRLTGGVKSINTDHYYIHRGIAYKAYITLAEVTGTPVEYSFKTPDDLYPHFKNLHMVALGGTLKVTIKRGTTAAPLNINSAGVDSDDVNGPFNLNDNSANVTGVVIKKTPTYNEAKAGADWFRIQVVGDTTNQFTSVAETASNDNEEIVMLPDTYYVIRLERIGTDSPKNILLTLFWYEEPEGVL